MENKKLSTILLLSIAVFTLSEITSCSSPKRPDEKWKAPPEADKLKSPSQNSVAVEQKAQGLYNLYCSSCHGETGLGDGPAAQGRTEQPPANFHAEPVQSQSDGALFWKISTGRGNMPAFNTILSKEERWQLVSYLRKLPGQPASLITPVALRPDIKVEHFMRTGALAIRILQNPTTAELWYTSIDGDVFRIKNADGGQPVSEKIFSGQDHGIEVLQGAVFLNNILFLCGNSYFDNKRSTQGRMVRYKINDSGQHTMSVVFTTAEYAANKTIYDHGWNALAISPDSKYIYVNSGARTDHGEVQDNGGAFPNARDNALTAKIFRFPVDATNLLLPDDEGKLKADGYICAEGIRNAYDMAFDHAGNLFAVSNSADYDYPEDMFWIKQHHHYGFPWVMGGMENPQQYNDWHPDADKDPFINKASHSWEAKYYYNDPGFPKRPPDVNFSPGMQNAGPDANEYRGHSGKIQDGNQTGVAISTFTAHSSPLGLFFDTGNVLSNDFKGDGFVIRYASGATNPLLKPFTNEGADLLHLKLFYETATDNYFVNTTRIVEGFKQPIDAVMAGNVVYVIEYGGKEGNIWKITLPKETK